MGNKDKDEAIDKLEDLKPTEEAKEEAETLAEQHTNSSSGGGGGGSGSVVTKYQLCGRYCDGCPHGPYAWLVTDDGWKYLGKVGAETQGKRSQNDASQKDEAKNNLHISPDNLEEFRLEGTENIGDLVLVEGIPARIKSIGITDDNRNVAHVEYLNPPRDKLAGLPKKLERGRDGTLHPTNFEWGQSDPYVVTVPDDVTDDIARYSVYQDSSVETGKSAAKGITLDTVSEGEYGPMVEINSSYSDKDAIKSLDWEDTHRSWDREKERWTVDLDSTDRVIEELTDKGNTVSVRNEVLMLSDSTSYHPSADGDEIGEHSWIGETEEEEVNRLVELAQKEE